MPKLMRILVPGLIPLLLLPLVLGGCATGTREGPPAPVVSVTPRQPAAGGTEPTAEAKPKAPKPAVPGKQETRTYAYREPGTEPDPEPVPEASAPGTGTGARRTRGAEAGTGCARARADRIARATGSRAPGRAQGGTTGTCRRTRGPGAEARDPGGIRPGPCRSAPPPPPLLPRRRPRPTDP